MSFPAILRNPGLSDRFAHLRVRTQSSATPSPAAVKRNRRDEKEGKRWVRRKENARFVGNAHIVAPSRKDFSIPAPSGRTTFPEPLPQYLSRNNPIPPAVPAAREPMSANAGRFSMSLKGMRRELRKSGPRTEVLVKEVEEEIVDWLTAGGVMLSPDSVASFDLPGMPIGTSGAINEVSRSPLQLVWSIADDAFTRYVVHCCARYHDVVSFSKDTSGQRLTYLLRPNVTRPTHSVVPTLDTPPVTDLSELSATDFDTESELVSDRDLSDVEGPNPNARMTAIVEAASDASAPSSPAMGAVYVTRAIPPASASGLESDAWSVLGESDVDVEGDLSASEDDLAGSVASLSLSDAGGDIERTPVAIGARRRQGPDALRSRLLERQRRSASSPSPSPSRRAPTRPRQRAEHASVRPQVNGRRSFYDYLFA
ncbi:hypothetical protein K466DRAFT_485508 [Polyporus arcularius HHB13444]|uniref:Uncharacterized protein n=1 Tax=Polyporus arcularius HHB13444 TaxID=1314778 RepID=A0A5C3PJT9_9APHY|nr:hypothetical protein K466DRAFT_485508 [Polyporus arcularius HHB13444]